MNALLFAALAAFSAVSPDGRNEIRMNLDDGIRYSVWRDGKELLAPSAISLSVKGHPFAAKVVDSRPYSLAGEVKSPIYKKAALPLVAEYADGTCVSVTEADQRDYPGWRHVAVAASCHEDLDRLV